MYLTKKSAQAINIYPLFVKKRALKLCKVIICNPPRLLCFFLMPNLQDAQTYLMPLSTINPRVHRGEKLKGIDGSVYESI